MRIIFSLSLLFASFTAFSEITTMADYLGKCCPHVMKRSDLSEEDKSIIKSGCTQFEARPENVAIGLKSCDSPGLAAKQAPAAAKRKAVEAKAAELASKKAALAARIEKLKEEIAARKPPAVVEPEKDQSVITSPLQYLNKCCIHDIAEEDLAICERSHMMHQERQQICERRKASGVR